MKKIFYFLALFCLLFSLSACTGKTGEAGERGVGILDISKTASDVNEAVRLASLDIKEIGGTVLFSPATASFDCYKNYAERGEAFINAVKNYASE